ncbi:MAG: hypothetical protein HPY76_09105, partial [Anaerolineae bacterium]|nr:hypothetical protein [Anaerolineae bacterium]
DAENRLVFRGGAGGATALGGAMALWFPSLYYIFPIGAAIFFFAGYASLTTISISLLSLVIFTIRAIQGVGPWEYVLYGLLSLLIVLWALRPNLKRLAEGTERLTGLRGHLHRKKAEKENPVETRARDATRNRRVIKEFSDPLR